MSEQKTEKPTYKKLRDARREGNVVVSRELSKLAVFALFTLMLPFVGPWLVEHMGAYMLFSIEVATQTPQEALPAIVGAAAYVVGLSFAAVCGALSLAAILASLVQTGPLFAPKRLIPNLGRMNPLSNLKQMFSARALGGLAIKILFATVLTFMVYFSIRASLGTLGELSRASPLLALQTTATIIVALFQQVCGILLVLVGANVAWDRFQHYKTLRMGKQEVRREDMEQNGNPHIKGKRRSLHRELLETQAQFEGAAGSNAFVVNPTHFCTGIYYKRGVTPLPLVMVKGEDAAALELIEYAIEAGKPVIRDIDLARALYARAEINHYVPDDLLVAVAQIVRIVEKLSQEEASTST